jgi:hypothetical protein
LPEGYYALAEQHAGHSIADVLTLHGSPTPESSAPFWPLPPDTGGIALAEAPPRTQRQQTIEPAALARRRSLAIRHVSGHRLVALIEIVSPSNKDRPGHVDDFAMKAISALEVGVHLLLVDLFPPRAHDPQGMHGIIQQRLSETDTAYDLPEQEPLTLASYRATTPVDVYLEHRAVGDTLPDMPLFIRPDRYVPAPLETTYQAAYLGMPRFWRDILERPFSPH